MWRVLVALALAAVVLSAVTASAALLTVDGGTLQVFHIEVPPCIDDCEDNCGEIEPTAEAAEDAQSAAAEEPPSAPPMLTVEYEVQPGDTLTDIAARFGTGVETLVRFNQLQDPNRILLGQRLKVPSHAEQQAGAITRIPG